MIGRSAARFRERQSHPLKHWKLSPVDMASLGKWDEYTKAREVMFFYNDTTDAPWTVVKSECKKRARLNAMRYVLHTLPYANKDLERIEPRWIHCCSAVRRWSTSAARRSSRRHTDAGTHESTYAHTRRPPAAGARP